MKIKLSKSQWEKIGEVAGWIKTSGKTWKDQKNYEQVILYHASPNRIAHLTPRSNFAGYKGLFMSPSYKSTIQDWAFYIIGRKKDKHTLMTRWYEVCDEIAKLESQIEEIEKKNTSSGLLLTLKLQLQKLKDKRSDIGKSMSKDSFSDSNRGYGTLYIHKIACPKYVYRQAVGLFDAVHRQGYKKDQWGFWGWGKQVFIPDKWLSNLEILGVEDLNIKNVIDKYNRMDAERCEHMEHYKDPAYRFAPPNEENTTKK